MDIIISLTSRIKTLENDNKTLKCVGMESRLDSLENEIKSLKQRVSAIEAKLLMSSP